jgi:hypothetical protein
MGLFGVDDGSSQCSSDEEGTKGQGVEASAEPLPSMTAQSSTETADGERARAEDSERARAAEERARAADGGLTGQYLQSDAEQARIKRAIAQAEAKHIAESATLEAEKVAATKAAEEK